VSPVAYLIVSLFLTGAALTCIFWIAWRSFGRPAHALTWCLAFAFFTLQRGANLASGAFNDARSYWTVVNGLAILSVAAGFVGHRQRARLPLLLGLVVGSGVAVQAAVAWVTYAAPHVGLRMGLQPLHAGFFLLWMGWIVYRFRPKPRMADVGAAVVHAAFGALQLAAGVVAVLQGAGGDPYFLDAYRMLNFLAMPAAFTGMGLFVVLILASDLAEEMRSLAVTDLLTGLLNRRGFEEAARRTLAQAQRAGQQVALVVADIDHFKAINDTWGHGFGDRAIATFAAELRRGRRADDLVGRIGGEEFALLLPNTPADTAVEMADAIRRGLRHIDLQAGAQPVRLEASFGVASLRPDTTSLQALLSAADRALYDAKEAGRNRVERRESILAAEALRPESPGA